MGDLQATDPARTAPLATFEDEYRVRFDEAGPDGTLRPSGFLRYAQDLAWRHSEAVGYDRARYRDSRVHWLVRGVELEERSPVPYSETLRAVTRVTGWRRVWARRLTSFHLAGMADPVAEMTTDWVLLDGRGRPARVPVEVISLFGTDAAFTPMRLAGWAVDPAARRHVSHVALGEVDPMGHLNHASWLDRVQEVLVAEAGEASIAATPRTWRLEYLRPAAFGATLESACRTVREGLHEVRIDDAVGVELLRASLAARGRGAR